MGAKCESAMSTDFETRIIDNLCNQLLSRPRL
jgi:hypothetical protein